MFKFKDRRKEARYPVTEQLSVRFNDNFLNGTECSDISLGGMCIVFEDKIDKEFLNCPSLTITVKYAGWGFHTTDDGKGSDIGFEKGGV